MIVLTYYFAIAYWTILISIFLGISIFLYVCYLYLKIEEQQHYRLNLIQIKDRDVIIKAPITEHEKVLLTLVLENISNRKVPPYDIPKYVIIEYNEKITNVFQIIEKFPEVSDTCEIKCEDIL